MSNIIDFTDHAKRQPAPAFQPEKAFRETPRQWAGTKRNPLRQHANSVSTAVLIAGQLLATGRTDQRQGWGDHVAWLRRGADAARLLAGELDRLAREEGNQ